MCLGSRKLSHKLCVCYHFTLRTCLTKLIEVYVYQELNKLVLHIHKKVVLSIDNVTYSPGCKKPLSEFQTYLN